MASAWRKSLIVDSQHDRHSFFFPHREQCHRISHSNIRRLTQFPCQSCPNSNQQTQRQYHISLPRAERYFLRVHVPVALVIVKGHRVIALQQLHDSLFLRHEIALTEVRTPPFIHEKLNTMALAHLICEVNLRRGGEHARECFCCKSSNRNVSTFTAIADHEHDEKD